MQNRPDLFLIKSKEAEKMLGKNDDRRWLTALSILEQGDLKGASRLALQILEAANFKISPPRKAKLSKDDILELLTKDFSTQVDGFIPRMVVGAIMNQAYLKNSFDNDPLQMTAKAVDVGLTDFAYNVANRLYEIAKSPSDFQKSEHYYKIAIEYAEDDSSKAAALVNYCPIVRDGMITGERDLIKAIEIYEEAAKLGLVIGMFNTANVCQWLEEPEKSAYREKALYWLNAAVNHITSHKKLLDMDNPESCKIILNQSRFMIGTIHSAKDFAKADLNAGITALKAYVSNNTNEELGRAWHLEQCYARRIAALEKPLENTPANRWKFILSAMDWETSTPYQLEDFGEYFYASGSGETKNEIAVFVSNGFFEPGKTNSLLENLKLTRLANDTRAIIVLSPFGVFQSKGADSFVAVTVIHNKKVTLAAIRAGMAPEQVARNAETDIEFHDKRYASCSCIIPIAINKLMTGAPVNKAFNYEAPFLKVGDWNIPWEGDMSMLKRMKAIL